MSEAKKEVNILCLKGKESIFACQNKNCEKYVFMCADKECDCSKNHLNCVKAGTKDLIVNVFKKIGLTKQLEDHIYQVIDKTIGELSDLRDKLIL